MFKKQILIYLYSAIICFFLLFNVKIQPLGLGIDLSWFFTINYAFANNALWGKDLVFTYGPYGFLIFPQDISNNFLYHFIYQLLFTFVSSVLVIHFLKSFGLIKIKFFIFLIPVLAYIIAVQPYEWRIFVLCIMYLISTQSKKTDYKAYINIGALIGFSTLIKFSLGIGLLPVAVFSCVLVNHKVLTAKKIACLLISFSTSLCILWVLYQKSFIGLREYLTSGIYFSKGYSSAMTLYNEPWTQSLIYFLILFVLLLLWLLQLKDNYSREKLLIFVPAYFVAWKASVVRQDTHMLSLICFSIFSIITVILLSLRSKTFNKTTMYALVSLTLVILGTTLSNNWPEYKSNLVSPLLSWNRNSIKTINYIVKKPSQLINDSQITFLPKQVITEIGPSSIDFYPTDNVFAKTNNLNWKGRPVIQSYAAFTPELDSIDYNFFSNTPPEFLLVHYYQGFQTIDNRNMLFDEPKTALKIIDNYNLVGANNFYNILKLSDKKRFGTKTQIKKENAKWNKWLQVPQLENSVLLVEANWGKNITEKLRRLLFRENPVYLSFKFSDNHIETFRIIPDNLISGLLVNPIFSSGSDLNAFLNQKMITNVKYIKFNGNKNSKDLDITWYKLPLNKVNIN